jgi:anti-sigma B factor antagonist
MTETPSSLSPVEPWVPAVDGDPVLNVQLQWQRWLRIAGELDVASAPVVHQAAQLLAEQPAQDLLIDMNGVTFLDAAGLGALIALAIAQRQAGAELTFVGLSSLCRELFTLADAKVLLDAIAS